MKQTPTSFLKTEYEELVKKNLDWKLRILESGSKPHSIVDGKEVIMLCSNNYLNLSSMSLVTFLKELVKLELEKIITATKKELKNDEFTLSFIGRLAKISGFYDFIASSFPFSCRSCSGVPLGRPLSTKTESVSP